MSKTPITVAYGDGIGPEIMQATLRILDAAGAQLDPEVIEIGEQVYLRGISSGIEPGAYDSLRRTKVFLKAPITTPQGGGFKSLNVTTRKTFGLFANIRPCVAYAPFVDTKYPGMDVVVVRENEEDLYAGIEYRQSRDVTACIKLISRPGSEKIVRYAFEYARSYGRKKVTCFAKDNIMKITDGLFHQIFDEVGREYPDIQQEFWIVDIGAAKLADSPELFDVVVMPNLYGDILSDVAAQIAGSVGLAGSANIGDHCAMFEAIHGSAPRRAGQNVANPSGLLLGAVQMLVHIGQATAAEKVHNAWLRTLEEGIHTYDVFVEGRSSQKVGTQEFSAAVCERMGRLPETLKAVSYASAKQMAPECWRARLVENPVKTQVGVDVYINWEGAGKDEFGTLVSQANGSGLSLKMIDNRGVKVWPNGQPETFCSDQWRCRFTGEDGAVISHQQVIDLLTRLAGLKLDFIKTEGLHAFDGVKGYSMGQGE